MSTVDQTPVLVKPDFSLRAIRRLRAIPVAQGGREVGARYEVEMSDGAIHFLNHATWRGVLTALASAGASLRHLNVGLEMYCRGTEQVVMWPPATAQDSQTSPADNRAEPAGITTLAQVSDAFEQLIAWVLGSGCDAREAATIHHAASDILAILRGDWNSTDLQVCPVCDGSVQPHGAGYRCEDCRGEWPTAQALAQIASQSNVLFCQEMAQSCHVDD